MTITESDKKNLENFIINYGMTGTIRTISEILLNKSKESDKDYMKVYCSVWASELLLTLENVWDHNKRDTKGYLPHGN